MRISILLTALLGLNYISFGQAPPSWTVNPNDYAYDMSVTAYLVISGRTSNNGNDVVAAFVNNNVVGVGSPSIFVASTGQTVVFLTIYSNVPAGETVTFELYDSQLDRVVTSINSTSYVSNSQVGSNTNPMLITDNYDPTDISLSNASIVENSAAGSEVGTMSTSDLNHSNGFVYSLVSGIGDTDNALFTVSGDKLVTAQVLNFEVNESRTVRIQTVDPMGSSYQEAFTIAILNANDAPTDIALSTNSFAENNEPGSVIGTLSAVDEDLGETFVYTLSGTDAGAFQINGSNLVIPTSADFETQPSYSISITVQDQGGTGLTFQKGFTIQVINLNEAPTNIDLSNNVVAEQSEIATVIGTFTVTDEDVGDTHGYKFENGTDTDGVFLVSGTELLLASPLDYKERSLYLITIRVTDSGNNIFTKLFQIQVTSSEPEINDTVLSVDENTENTTVVGIVEASDPDGDAITYSFVFDDPFFDPASAPFIIDPSSGEVTVNDVTALDYEKVTQFNYTVQVTDESGLTAEADLLIVINDLIELGVLPLNEVITPNNDGYNDVLKIINIQLYEGYTMAIYNANGIEVYRKENYNNDWNAVSNSGKNLDPGTYYYRFSNGDLLFKGKLTIIRN